MDTSVLIVLDRDTIENSSNGDSAFAKLASDLEKAGLDVLFSTPDSDHSTPPVADVWAGHTEALTKVAKYSPPGVPVIDLGDSSKVHPDTANYILSAATRSAEKLASEEVPLSTRKENELALWTHWKETKDPQSLKKLYKSYEPLIRKVSKPYESLAGAIDPGIVDTQFRIAAFNGFNTYDPSKGTQLSTHLNWSLMAAKKDIGRVQNSGRIPQARMAKITTFQNTRDSLTESLGREPTHEEISSVLNWKPSEVKRLTKEIGTKTLAASSMEGDPADYPTVGKDSEILFLMEHGNILTPDELEVAKRLIGFGGHTQQQPKQISMETGFSQSKISRLRQTIGSKIQAAQGRRK